MPPILMMNGSKVVPGTGTKALEFTQWFLLTGERVLEVKSVLWKNGFGSLAPM